MNTTTVVKLEKQRLWGFIIIIILIIIIIIIIIIINCNWVVARWQWLFYVYTEYEIGY